jgi:ribosome biogenesis GTPase A
MWSPNDLEIFKYPMCLISTVSENNKEGEETKILLKSEEKVFDQIAKIDWPMVVVAVAGLYRTGKSYLMNCLAESNKGNLTVYVSVILSLSNYNVVAEFTHHIS